MGRSNLQIMAGEQRIKKVNELLKREFGKIILKEIGFPKNILVTLTRVETSGNLQQSKVFISVIPEKETLNVLRILGKEIYNLQQILNRRLAMRPVPKIKFLIETKIKEAARIEELLEKIEKEEGK